VTGWEGWSMVGVALLCAAAGVLVGWRFLDMTTFSSLRVLIGGLLLLVGIGLIVGLL